MHRVVADETSRTYMDEALQLFTVEERSEGALPAFVQALAAKI